MGTFPPKAKWKKYWSEEEFYALVSDKEKGWPIIQETCGIGREAVRYWQKKLGIHFKLGRKPIITYIDDALFVAWGEAGISAAEVARRLGVGPGVVQRIYRELGVNMPYGRWRKFFSEDGLKALLKTAEGRKEIQKATRYTMSHVKLLAKQYR